MMPISRSMLIDAHLFCDGRHKYSTKATHTKSDFLLLFSFLVIFLPV